MVDAPESPRPQEQTPQKNVYQNGVRTTGRAFHSPNWRVKREESPSGQNAAAGSPGPKTSTSRLAFSRPSPHVPQAISEGRRLYVGNMPYTAKSEDVQALFDAAEFRIERIDIAIDPFTGRNPSYCFVDLETKELAERAMTELDGRDMLGRPVKIKPGVVKTQSERAQQQQQQQQRSDASPRETRSSPFSMDRWRRGDEAQPPRTPSKTTTTTTASTPSNSDPSRRLYVGGLPRLTDQEAITSNMTNFWLFVDFSSVEEAENAMNALNRAEGPWGAVLRVQRARGENNSQERRPKWSSSRDEATPAAEEVAVAA